MDHAPELPAIVALLDGRLAPPMLEFSRTSVRRMLAAGAEATMAALADTLDPEAVHTRATEWTELRDLLCALVPACIGIREGVAQGLWTLQEMAAPNRSGDDAGPAGKITDSTAWRPTMEFLKTFLDISLRFRSGNCVPVERAMLPRHAWKVLRQGATLGYTAARLEWEATQKAADAARHPDRTAPSDMQRRISGRPSART